MDLPPLRIGECRWQLARRHSRRPELTQSGRPQGQAGLVAGERGHHERARQTRGPCGRKSGRSRQAREQAAPGLRGRWAAADRGGHCRQRRRYHHVRGVAGRRPADPHAVGAAAHPACGGPRGQGLRQPSQPGLAAAAWGSGRGLPGVGSSRRRALDGIGGRSSGRCRGWVAGGGCRCAGTGTRVGSSPWCWWPARSSASTGSRVVPG
jgi:hypothetical protein